MKHLLFLLIILTFGCYNPCESQQKHLKTLIKPIIVKKKELSNVSNNGYNMILIDAKGIELYLSPICKCNDSLIINYNKGDTIK